MKVFALCFCLLFVLNVVISPTYATERECTVHARCKSPSPGKSGKSKKEWMTFATQDDIKDITTEFSLLKENNAVMESEIDRLKSEAEINKDDSSKKLALLNEAVEGMEKEANESKATMDDATEQIKLLKVRNTELEHKFVVMETKFDVMEKNLADIAMKAVQGEMGPRGEIGPIGPKGEEGQQGDVGPLSPKGDIGTSGEKGSKGEVGGMGPTGGNGPQGKIGEPGPKGEIGHIGPKGEEGPQGEVGPSGPMGDIGTSGEKGSQGEVGAMGPAGGNGPQGEIGEPGPMGEIGPVGEPGSVDSLAIGNIIKVGCPVFHETKCFFPAMESRVDYDGGVAVCESFGGHLANIYSQTHMDDVKKYIRDSQLENDFGDIFRLGMKYDPKAEKFTLRDGTDAPAGLKWNTGAPYNVAVSGFYADRTNVILHVKSDPSSTGQYLFNNPPQSTFYPLCEIE